MRPALLACLALAACLPDDTRPPPGVGSVYAVGAAELAGDIPTADGWSLRFERTLAAIAVLPDDPAAQTSGCEVYSGNTRDYLLDMQSKDPQKVLHLAAIGTCASRVLLPFPGEALRLGVNTTEAQANELRQAAPGGAAMYLAGVATRGAERKRFSLAIDRPSQLAACHSDASATQPVMRLSSGEQQRHTITLHPERLFLEKPLGALRFDPIAAADIPADGLVTGAELAAVKLDGLPHEGGAYEPTDPGDLWSWMLDHLLLQVVTFDDGGTCSQRTTPETMPPDGKRP